MSLEKRENLVRYLIQKINDNCIYCGRGPGVEKVSKATGLTPQTIHNMLKRKNSIGASEETIEILEWWIWKELNKKDLETEYIGEGIS